MSNFPRFGRVRQRPSVAAPPVPATAQPSAAEPQPVTILPFVEPSPPAPAPPSPPRESPRRILSPAKKATSPSASPKYGDFVAPTKLNRSPPPSSGFKLSEGRNGETSPPRSPAKSWRATTPLLSPLALPRTQLTSVNETAAQVQPRIQPAVEQKTIVYNQTVDKPAKSDRPSEYSSDKLHQNQKPAEVITLTGHNIGAVMEMNKSSAGHRLGGETIKKSGTEGGDGGNEEKKKGTKKKKKEAPMTAFMNSNFQSVNNSVLYESSCNHRDPGLHLAFSDAAEGGGETIDGHRDYKFQ